MKRWIVGLFALVIAAPLSAQAVDKVGTCHFVGATPETTVGELLQRLDAVDQLIQQEAQQPPVDPTAKVVIGMPPPAKDRKFGWAGRGEAKRARIAMGADFPAELGTGGESLITEGEFTGRVVKLWEFVRDRNSLNHWRCDKQEIGDCTSWGWSHSVLFTLAVNQVLSGASDPLEQAFPPYIYGYSRVYIGGGKIHGDGGLGAWNAAAAKQGGYVTYKQAGVPYSGQLARQWGKSGPPANLIELGKKSLGDVRLIKTFEEACSAIATGHAVAVCSDVGFETIKEQNGRIEGVKKGSWPHCMCFCAFDARPGMDALYCWNSWGPDAHAPTESYARLDGAPPGGFWVLRKDAETMLSQEDSFAVSFTGFKSAPLWDRAPVRKEDMEDAPLAISRELQVSRGRDRRVPIVLGSGLGL